MLSPGQSQRCERQAGVNLQLFYPVKVGIVTWIFEDFINWAETFLNPGCDEKAICLKYTNRSTLLSL
jgi:hypothetical protein